MYGTLSDQNTNKTILILSWWVTSKPFVSYSKSCFSKCFFAKCLTLLPLQIVYSYHLLVHFITNQSKGILQKYHIFAEPEVFRTLQNHLSYKRH